MVRIGSRIDERYEIISCLGSGSFSTAFRAKDLEQGTHVILKALAPENRTVSQEAMARFRREAAVLSELKHENIATFLGFREISGDWFLILELLEGISLARWIEPRREPSSDIPFLLSVLIRIAQGLDWAHGRGILHRDIKPSNVVLPSNDPTEVYGASGAPPGVKILDFGLARLIDYSRFAERGGMTSSFFYMAPEQAGLLRRPIDQRADLYSLGLLAYELLTGDRAYSGEEPAIVLQQHLTRVPVPAGKANRAVPEALSQIVDRLMAKSPEDRYVSAQALLADLKALSVSLARGRGTFALPPLPAEIPERPRSQVRLIERTREMEDLARCFAAARRLSGKCILVGGEAGIGKTRLIEDFRDHVLSRNGLFLYGTCDAEGSKVPYQPFAEILAQFAEQYRTWPRRTQAAYQGYLNSSDPDHRTLLARLVPDLSELVGPPPPRSLSALGPERDAERFMEAICRFCLALARPERPLVLAFDDLQWVQRDSLLVWLRLVQRLSGTSALVTALYRDEGIQEHPHLLKGLKRLRRMPEMGHTIRLKPLSPEGVRAMVRETTGISGGGYRGLYEKIFGITKGNPLFVRETVHVLVEGKVMRKAPGSGQWIFDLDHRGWRDVSTNLVEVVLRRVERLSTGTRRVLSVASAIRGPFEFELLLNATGEKEEDLLDHLDALLLHQLIEVARTGEHLRYQFFHDKIRQTVYEKLPEGERRRIHGRIGQGMLDQGLARGDPERDVFALAYHFCQGPDDAKALEHAIKAGDKARDQGASREALHAYMEAEKRLTVEDADRFFYVQENLGDLNMVLGAYVHALTAYRQAEAHAPSGLARARLKRKSASVLHRQGAFAEGVRQLEDALTLMGRHPPGNRVRIAVALLFSNLLRLVPGMPRSLLPSSRRKPGIQATEKELCRIYRELYRSRLPHDVLRSLDAYRLLWKYARRTGDLAVQAEACREQMIFHAHLRMFGTARRALTRALRIDEQLGDTWGMANTRCVIGYLDFFQGRLEEAERNIETGLPELDRVEAFLELEVAYIHLTSIHWATGDFVKALRCLEKMRDLLVDGNDDGWQVVVAACLALTHAHRKDGQKGLPYIEQLREICERSSNPHFQVTYHATVGTFELLQEQWREARTALTTAVQLIREHRLASIYTANTFLFLLSACFRGISGRPRNTEEDELLLAQAETVLKECRQLTWGFPLFSGQWWVLRGVYLGYRGRRRRAERAIRKGTSILERIGARYCLAQALEAAGRYHAARGEKSRGRDCETQAARMIRELGLWKDPGDANPVAPTDLDAPGASRSEARAPMEEAPALSVEARELHSVLEASRLLVASGLELNEVLERILKLSMTSLGAERGFLALYEEGEPEAERPSGERPSLRVLLARNMEQRDLGEEDLSAFSRSIVQGVERTKGPIVIRDARDATPRRESGANAVLPRSVLCVPLVDDGRLIGLTYLDNHLVSHLFSEKDLRFMQSLASFATIAIKNARAYEEIRRLKEKLHEEVVYLQEEIRTEHNFEEMIGSSPAMQEVFRFIERAAPLGQPVLIRGETGTGKELVARAIHRRSPRGDKPIIKINCASIPEGLLESELFGHEKGAFTGAIERKIGRFELAAGGTLFLDEIGEMRPALQAKLLRVLEDHEFERVGGTQTLQADVFMLSATNRNLEKEIEKGNFRGDLFYRLNVLPVRLPPLRERPEDIPLLLTHFISILNKKLDRNVKEVDKASLDAALAYPWPGNVRELRHLVERTMALSDTPYLKLTSLLLEGTKSKEAHVGPDPGEALSLAYHASVEAYKRSLIREALRRAGGTRKEAARLLSISPSNLSNLVRRLRIEPRQR